MVKKTYKGLWHKAASLALAMTLVVTGISPLAKTYAATKEKATKLEISNPVTVLHLGDKYDLNFDMEPFNNTEKTYWKSSNKAIADVDSYGRFTAKKLGVVRITAYTKSGLKSTCEILVVSKYGVTGVQRRVDRMLDSNNSRSIYIKNTKTANTYTIKEGRYVAKSLYVEAPLSEVDNYGRFKKITLVDIANGTFNEYAFGNTFVIKDKELSFNVDKDSTVKSISVIKESLLNLNVAGKVNNLTVSAPNTTLNLTGTGSVDNIVVGEKATGATLNVGVPTNITLNANAKVVLSEAAKGTTIVITGADTKVEIVNNTGARITVVNETTGKSEVIEPVGKTEEVTTPGGGSTGGGGTGGGGTTPSNTAATITGVPSGDTVTYTLPTAISNLKSAKVMIDTDRNGTFEKTHNINGDVLVYVNGLLNNEPKYLGIWKGLTGFSKTVGGITVSVNGAADSNTKTVGFDGVDYTVTVNASSVTLKKVTGVFTYTLSKDGSNKLIIESQGNKDFGNFVKFKVTY